MRSSRRGITEPFPVQRMVIGDVLAGRDVLVRSPTGSGKTLAFAVPIVDRSRPPTPPLSADTRPDARARLPDRRGDARLAHARALRVTAVYGGVGIQRQAQEAARSHILVATPGRLEDLIERGAFTLAEVKLLVLDEADRMLDMGFLPGRQPDRAPVPGRAPDAVLLGHARRARAAASPTSTRATPVRREHDPEPATSHRRGRAPLPRGRARQRVDALVRELRAERDLALVFVRTKRGADRLVKRLGHHGVEAVAMHGDKSQGQRERALARFEAGHVSTLVATDVAARGIDVDRISHVINYDPPEDRDAYVHRVGRTGRAGRDGVGITLLSAEQRGDVARLANELGIEHGLAGNGGSRQNRNVTGEPPRRRPQQRQRARSRYGR